MTNIIVNLNYTLVVQICQEGMKKAGEKANCFLFRLGCSVYQVFVRIACTVMKERNVHSIIIVQPLTGWNGRRHAERAHELQRQQDNQHNHRHNEQRRERLLAP